MKYKLNSYNLSDPTLYIGIGGTGVDIIRYHKANLIAKYGSRIPPHIRFMGIDTTDQVVNNGLKTLGGDEFFTLEVREPERMVSMDIHKTIRQWWPDLPKTRSAIHAGARQIRAIGRLALFSNISEIEKEIRERIEAVIQLDTGMHHKENQINTSKKINIFIVNSLCGGTGSGMFLDVALICRHHLRRNIGRINGIFVLPTVFESKAGMYWTYSNTYAALLELDHLMSVAEKKKETVNYTKSFSITIANPPFDTIYLADNQNERTSYVSDPDKLKRFVAEELGLMLTSEFSIQEEQNFANWENVGRVEQGKKLNYSSFGHCFVKAVDVAGRKEASRLAARYAVRLSEVEERGERRLVEKEKNIQDNQLLNIARGKKELWQKIQYDKQQIGEEALQQAINNPLIRDRLSSQVKNRLEQAKNSPAAQMEEAWAGWAGALEQRLRADTDELLAYPGGAALCERLLGSALFKLEEEHEKLVNTARLATPATAWANGNGSAGRQPARQPARSVKGDGWLGGIFPFFGNGRKKTAQEAPLSEEEKAGIKEQVTRMLDEKLRAKGDLAPQQAIEKAMETIRRQYQAAVALRKSWESLAKRLSEEQQEAHNGSDPEASYVSAQFQVTIPNLQPLQVDLPAFKEKAAYGLNWGSRSEEELLDSLDAFAGQSSGPRANGVPEAQSSGLEQALTRLMKKEHLLKGFFGNANHLSTPLLPYSVASMELGASKTERRMFIGYPDSFTQDFLDSPELRPLAAGGKQLGGVFRLKAYEEVIFSQKVMGIPAFAILNSRPDWTERYWADGEEMQNHIWKDPQYLEDLFPNNKPEAWQLVGKAQAYGLLPWDHSDSQPWDEYFGFEGILQGQSGWKALYSIYMNLLCDVENDDFERLETIVEWYERGNLSKGRLDKRVKDAIDNVRPEPADDKAFKNQVRGFIKKLEKKCKDPEEKLSTPVKRFYLRMIEELDRSL